MPPLRSHTLRASLAVLAIGLCALLVLDSASAPAKPGRLGVDVSRFNGAIDWERAAGAGVRFAFIAASRGRGDDCAVVPKSCGQDPNFDANYEGARAAGIRVGPYHRAFIAGDTYRDLIEDARAEADVFIKSVGGLAAKDLAPALDVETPFDVAGRNALKKWIRAWVKRVRRKLTARPIIYTNATSWAATGNTREFAKRGHRLWVANWGVSKPAVPAANWGSRGWAVWQYTSSGSIPGIVGRVDLNRLRVRFSRLRGR
ncbi:MAG: glycosyl hydrolase family 25 [Solirubrobacterales bacterium]|nr:glycosyl hydrolase family 25 [Solirubrobacterales bacterium]